ncbi:MULTISPECIES: pseudouridine synthase [unclassified Corallococcus]|uniref:pseudouridine synthase n=1 Tax=unclassified Corallococcus TaxID=2685029 RepID=UPI001A8FB933|nr:MULTISPECIES: pseudouridine synthase [unclassified Corallococcus]MBN9685275.1 pseudouridine synthase [Corallococcus sp. NCSPR001]WAS83271.1 pseudouridine synthase [Corallococcus sp. NCRR]
MAAERLQKYLARAGVASRRHAEELITSGRVGVNNETVTELGSRVEPGVDLVTVDGKLVTPPEESSYYLLYKPVGVVTTLSDPQGRPTVASYVEETGRRLFPVGRLDYDAEGALLFTDDGALAHKLTHPSFQVPRTYLAKVKGVPDMPTLEKLRGGVRLEDGMATPVSVDIFEKAERNTWLKIVVAEGRPHLIKRLCAAVGHPVVRLFRPNYAGIGVEGLRPGELRKLKTAEVMQLTEVAEGRAQPNASDLKLPPRRHGRSAPGFGGADDDDMELSMDDDAPVAPRKTERAAKKAPATGPKTREARPERKEWKGVQDGGTRPPKFAKRGATLAADDGADLDDVPTFDDEGDEVESDAAEGATYGKAARGAGRSAKPEGERAPRGAARFGKPAGAGRSEGGASRGGSRFGAEGGASRGGGRFGAEGGASRGGSRFGKPAGAGRSEGGAGRFGKPARAGSEGDAPRGGGRFGKPAGRFGDEGGAPRGGGRFGKPAGRGGDEGGAPRGGGRFGKPAGAGGDRPERREWKPRGESAGRFGGEEGGAPRGGGRFGKPAGAGRGGDEGGAGRFGKPARAGRGGDEAPRSGFGRPARAGAEGGASRGGDRFGKPSSRFGGEEGGAPRGGGRFGKPASRGGDEGAPRGGSRFGAEGGASRGGGRFGKPAGRFGDEGGAPRGGGRFGKPAGRFGDEGGAPRGGGRFGKPAGRFGAEGGASRGGGRFGKPAGAGRGGDEGGAPRGRFSKPAGGSRFGGEEGGARGGGRFGKPAGAGRSEGGARGGTRFGKPAGAGGDRPERREWKPRGESAGRPERKPRGEDSGSRSRGGGGASSSASGERIVRAGVKKGPPSEGGGYQDFKERKTRASEPSWSSKAPRGGAGRPPPRGGRSR